MASPVERWIARVCGPALAALTRCHCRRPGSYAYGWDHLTSGHHLREPLADTRDGARG
jgi:hypothetical protein